MLSPRHSPPTELATTAKLGKSEPSPKAPRGLLSPCKVPGDSGGRHWATTEVTTR